MKDEDLSSENPRSPAGTEVANDGPIPSPPAPGSAVQPGPAISADSEKGQQQSESVDEVTPLPTVADASDPVVGTGLELGQADVLGEVPVAPPDVYAQLANRFPHSERESPAPLDSSETGEHVLPNGMVDRPYRAVIDLATLGVQQQPDIHPTFEEELAACGLIYQLDSLTLLITGTPSKPGEHTLLLRYGYGDGERKFHKKISFLINPDPKSLWKAIEPDAQLPYRKQHNVAERVVGNDLHLVAASRRGRSHAHEGKFREDDFAVMQTVDRWYVTVVADGAGSAGLSREGSRLACTVAAKSTDNSLALIKLDDFESLLVAYADPLQKTDAEKNIKRLLYQTLCGAAFDAYKSIEQHATESGSSIKEYATTFLLAIARKFEKRTFVAAFWVGDGAIGVYDERSGTTKLMGTPDSGEFSGQTRFLTMKELIADSSEMLSRVRFEVLENLTAVILMTDGVSDPKFGTDRNLLSHERWSAFWQDLSSLVDFSSANDAAPQQLLDWTDFWSPGEHDDRTLVIMC